MISGDPNMIQTILNTGVNLGLSEFKDEKGRVLLDRFVQSYSDKMTTIGGLNHEKTIGNLNFEKG
jgi:hypothetical protein